jgi:hypothetical protein
MNMDKDVFDYIDESEKSTTPDRSGKVWNILTILVLLTTLSLGILFIIVLINPYVGFNPFPPPVIPELMALNTLTPTPREVLPPTWTPVVSLIPTKTSTPVPEAPEATQEEQVDEGDDRGGDPEIVGDMPVVLHEGSPQYIPSFSYHPDVGCSWMGVAGQGIDVTGAPVVGLFVGVGGLLGGKNIGNPTLLQMTGLVTAYGDGGYEVKLADQPVDSTGSLWIQIKDQAGLPLSEKIQFYTFEDCERNLIVIHFKKVQ